MTRFRVDNRRSEVTVDLRVNLHPSHVRVGRIGGVIDCELGDGGLPRLEAPYGAQLRIPVASMKSGNALQDVEMRRRFDTRRHPEIQVDVVRGRVRRQPGEYHATAVVTMHGVAREISGDVHIRVHGHTMMIEGEHELNIEDFDIDAPRLLLLRMEPRVTVHARIVAASRG